MTYEYYINCNERGSFNADVRDADGQTVYEIDAESTIFDDGFMWHETDMKGLEQYLKSLEVIPENASIVWGC